MFETLISARPLLRRAALRTAATVAAGSILAGVVAGSPAAAATDPAAQAVSSAAWTFKSSSVTTATSVDVTATFTAPTPTSGLLNLNLEVWDTSKKAFQRTVKLTMSSAQTSTVKLSLPLATTPPGAYTVRQGVWDGDWAPKIAGMAQTSSLRVIDPSITNTEKADPDAGDPLAGHDFYGPHPNVSAQVTAWSSSRPADAKLLNKLSSIPMAKWFAGKEPNIGVSVQRHVDDAAAQRKVPVLVAYNIPNRDCGNHSSGGAVSEEAYKAWVQEFAASIGTRKAVVVVEPDALAQLCGDVAARYRNLNAAVDAFSALPNAVVYLDAGVVKWLSVDEAANRLRLAGVDKIRGFSLNVANYKWNSENETYGNAISAKLGGKHFVIDTSRNGKGYNGEWCNPTGRAVGRVPTASVPNELVDAYLWIKTVGISDGPCNGGPAAGTWWADYALSLVRNAGW